MNTNESAFLRAEAAVIFGRIGDKKAIEPLKKALNDKSYDADVDRKVNDAAFASLQKISERTGIIIYQKKKDKYFSKLSEL